MTSRSTRRWWFGLLALFLTLGFSFTVRPAAAADQDRIDSFDATYRVQPSGQVSVTEKIVYRFGADSGRHGIQRQLITREQWNDDQDAVYTIDNVQVSSPSGAPDQFEQISEGEGKRTQSTVLRIGDPDRTVDTDTATYEISYDLGGAMRNSPGYDEFYWDVTGSIETPQTDDVSVTVSVPGSIADGASGLNCYAGPPARSSTAPCTGKELDSAGRATFTQDALGPEQGLTIAVKLPTGAVRDNAPHLERDATAMTPAQRNTLVGGGVLGGLVAVGSPLVGVLWWRRKGRDQRYVDLPPGTVPYEGQPSRVGYNDPDLPIPVAFSPPKIPVAEAGLLVDGQVDPRETAATIVDLAVRGALTISSYEKDDYQLTLVDPNRAQAPHEMTLLTTLFESQPPGATADLSKRGSITPAHDAMVADVRRQVAARGWFRDVPKSKANGFSFGFIIFITVGLFWFQHSLWWLALLLLPVTITISVVRYKLRRGQRTPDGRAITDQVEGFKTYLATAEADQLRFEEGEDIFSRYLPWAIAFNLADRWAELCNELVAAGRLPNATPYWYAGSWGNMTAFNAGFLTSSITIAATPVPSSSGGGGTGFGGGSSFSGGGFSGGGGGGGGTSSW